MEKIRPVASLREYFRDSVAEAMHRQRVDADDHTAYYVVNLLTLFARSEALFDETSEGRQLRPVAKLLAEAAEAERDPERNYALQRAGDVSLFVAGFLGDGLARRLVDIDYYVQIGGSAYGALAHNVQSSSRGRAYGSVFAELAAKFQEFVDVLADIAGEAGASQTDVLRLYETWLATGSRRAARLLRANGIEPNLAGGGDTRH